MHPQQNVPEDTADGSTSRTSDRTASRTWAEIDLGAVRHNVRTLCRRASGARLMAVVKADAYGHGVIPISQTALDAGADSLAVATAEEGAELRRGGIEAPILVFTDLLPDRLDLAESFNLTVTAHSVQSAKRIAARPRLRAHLKVNTGMNRLGRRPRRGRGGAKSSRRPGIRRLHPLRLGRRRWRRDPPPDRSL